MHFAAAVAGLFLLLVVLGDTMETIVLPRGVVRGLRLTRLFYRSTWRVWSGLASVSRRPGVLLSLYGPLSLILLLGVWAAFLVLAFALLNWGLYVPFTNTHGGMGFGSYIYVSGTTFFTLGLGDLTPKSALGEFWVALEAGMGFGYLAIVIGYLPVLYQAFSRREVSISLLDARAGSPPTAVEMLRRAYAGGATGELVDLLRTWETAAADLMESHISYPALSYYRSQHDHQSWVASLAAIMDACAMLVCLVDGPAPWQARMTFAMARHAIVDLCLIFKTPPAPPRPNRLDAEQLAQARSILTAAGVPLRTGTEAERDLTACRATYEPYLNALAGYLRFHLPGWLPQPNAEDNWQASAWEHGPHF